MTSTWPPLNTGTPERATPDTEMPDKPMKPLDPPPSMLGGQQDAPGSSIAENEDEDSQSGRESQQDDRHDRDPIDELIQREKRRVKAFKEKRGLLQEEDEEGDLDDQAELDRIQEKDPELRAMLEDDQSPLPPLSTKGKKKGPKNKSPSSKSKIPANQRDAFNNARRSTRNQSPAPTSTGAKKKGGKKTGRRKTARKQTGGKRLPGQSTFMKVIKPVRRPKPRIKKGGVAEGMQGVERCRPFIPPKNIKN